MSDEERKAATILSRSLAEGKKLCEEGEKDAAVIRKAVADVLSQEPMADPEYIELVSTDTVKPVDTIEGEVLCAIAVRIGKTRLIDNFFFDPTK